jgi:CHAD domain-containing protein
LSAPPAKPADGHAPAPAPLLPRPPEEGARRLALSYLDQAARARPRLADADDAEALHDFRVGLRRLRSCLKAYDAELAGSLSKKLRRRLKRLAGSTGPGRDTEVQIEWLRSQGTGLTAHQRPGFTWLLARLRDRLRDAFDALEDEVADEFDQVEKDLRARLSVYRAEIHLDAGSPAATFAAATAAILREQVKDLEEHLAKVEDAGDQKPAHEARIRAKRLRYLLEPLADERPDAVPVIKRLKALQELLGDLHDAHVLEAEITTATGEAAAERARKLLELALAGKDDELRAERRRAREPGLLALARRNRYRRDRLFAKLQGDWLDGKAAGFFREVEGVGDRLAGDAE